MESIKNIFNDKNNIPIVFAFNDDYTKYFSVVFQSIIENANSEKKYDIVALISDVTEKSKKKLLKMAPKNFSLRFFDIENYVLNKDELKTIKYYTKDIYYRLYIPFLFQEYKKVLYIDCDTVVNKDIKKLKINFNNKELAAIKDTIVPFLDVDKERKNYIKNVLKIKHEKEYFNSGVLLFNIEKINLSSYKRKLTNAFKISELLFPDQDILNKIFENKVKFITRKWNFNSSPYVNADFYKHIKKEFKKEFSNYKNPNLIHYTSQYKPWNLDENPHYEFFWKYAKNSPFYKEILSVKKQAMSIKEEKFKDLHSKIKGNKKIMFWGASDFLKEFLKKYKTNSKNILGIIDLNLEKKGKMIENYKIFSIDEIKNINPDKIIITIINGDYKKEIQRLLTKEKIKAELITIN